MSRVKFTNSSSITNIIDETSPRSISFNSLNDHTDTQHPYSRSLRLDNVCYILSAKFDNKLGPVVKHQYPRCIPGFKNSLHGTNETDESINLASLMIPNNVELTPGKKDFTVFMLYFNDVTEKYEIFRPNDDSTSHNSYDHNNTIKEIDEFEDANENSEHSQTKVLYFINVVNTVIDKNDSRGAVINSIALVSPHKFCNMFRPLLSKILDQYMQSSATDSMDILIESFNMVNSIDLLFMHKIYSNEYLQLILQSINEENNIISQNNTLLNTLFEEKNRKTFKRIFKIPFTLTSDNFGNKVSITNKYIVWSFTNFESNILSTDILNMKLQMPFLEYDIFGSLSRYNNQILIFLSKFIPFVANIQTNNFKWRLIINSTLLSKDELCHYILILSNVISSIFVGNNEMKVYYKQNPILVFPYMDISMVDSLKRHLASSTSSQFAIIGVANPIFQFQEDLWDCYYDLDSSTLYDSKEGLIKQTNRIDHQITSADFVNILRSDIEPFLCRPFEKIW